MAGEARAAVVPGALLAALVREAGARRCCGGLLFGASAPPPPLRRGVSDEAAVAPQQPDEIVVLSYATAQDAPFYDRSGALLPDVFDSMLRRRCGDVSVVGWWIARSDVPAVPSLRDAAVHAALEARTPGPLLFVLVCPSTRGTGPSVAYRAVECAGGAFFPVPLHIQTLGHDSTADYADFGPSAATKGWAFASLPCDAGGRESASAVAFRHDRILLDGLVQDLDQLEGDASEIEQRNDDMTAALALRRKAASAAAERPEPLQDALEPLQDAAPLQRVEPLPDAAPRDGAAPALRADTVADEAPAVDGACTNGDNAAPDGDDAATGGASASTGGASASPIRADAPPPPSYDSLLPPEAPAVGAGGDVA
ncbi:hypothetical protein M885DRAFT_515259 [Pelagophyceae sp. CCMP2097]|nr:hypothetical protein M885DRAFT_515259 [Pelagophyceae sp. CCMP2097]